MKFYWSLLKRIIIASITLTITSSLYALKRESFVTEPVQAQGGSFISMASAAESLQTDANINITFYHLNIDIDIENRSVNGSVYIELLPTIERLGQVKLNLHNSLSVTSVSENANSWVHSNDILTLELSDYFNSDDTVKLRINYYGSPTLADGTIKGFRFDTNDGAPAIATLSTPYLAHYWYPCKDGPTDKADKVWIDITIPETYNNYELMALSNGKLVETITSDEKKTFKWQHNYPIVPYYVMIAVSDYQIISTTYNKNGHNFPLNYYTFPDSYSQAYDISHRFEDAFNCLIHYYGDYPFKNEGYAMTQIAPSWAIENQTNTIIGSFSGGWYITMVHELSHMWFGCSITNQTWNNVWLNEGFATYSEALYYEYTDNKEAYHSHMNNMDDRFGDSKNLYLDDDSDYTKIFEDFYYEKGAWILHMLRGYINNDELFFNFIKEYAQDQLFKYKYVTTGEFQNYAESSLNINLDTFFDQWVYDESYPDYKYNFVFDPATNKTIVTIYQSQFKQYGEREVFEMFVPVKFTFADGSTVTERVLNNSSLQTFYFDFTKEVSNISIDPDQWIIRSVEFDGTLITPLFPTITNFNIENQIGETSINNSENTIIVTMPYGYNLSQLSPTITITENASVSPLSGSFQDFSVPVVYALTTSTGTTREYQVTVNNEQNNQNEITSFEISGQVGNTVIDNLAKTVTITMPYNSDLSNLSPVITVSPDASINPASGVAHDFNSAISYIVTAQNGQQATYLVKVDTGSNPEVTYTWNGSISDDWEEAENWDKGGFTDGENAHIVSDVPNFPIINTDTNIRNITIDAGASLTQTNGILTVSGIFELKSTVGNNASYLPLGGIIEVDPENVKIEQIVANSNYNYAVSSPVTGALATKHNSGITGNSYTFDNPSNSFIRMEDDKIFEPGIGFVFKSSQSIVFSGDINTGEYNIPVVRTPKGRGWNHIGNPYTAAIDWRRLDMVNIDDTFWLYLNDSGIYGVYNNATGISLNLSSSSPFIIPSKQAIWVRVTKGQTEGSITFSTDALTNNNYSYLKTGKVPKFPYLKLKTIFNGHNDITAIALIPEATYGSNDTYDSEKFLSNNPDYCEIYSLSDGVPLAIGGYPPSSNMVIPLGISTKATGTIEISLSKSMLPENYVILLEDNITGESTSLSSGINYQFNIEKSGQVNNRFELILLNVTTSLEENNDEGNISKAIVYTQTNSIIAEISDMDNPHYNLYEIGGIMIMSGQLMNNSKNIISVNHKGILVLWITWEKGNKAYKVIF